VARTEARIQADLVALTAALGGFAHADAVGGMGAAQQCVAVPDGVAAQQAADGARGRVAATVAARRSMGPRRAGPLT